MLRIYLPVRLEEHQGKDEEGKDRSEDQSSYDHPGQGPGAFGTDAGGNGGRQQTDGSHKGCHQHGTDKIVYPHLYGSIQGTFLSLYPF